MHISTFSDLGTSWRWVVSFTPRPLYTRNPLNRRVGVVRWQRWVPYAPPPLIQYVLPDRTCDTIYIYIYHMHFYFVRVGANQRSWAEQFGFDLSLFHNIQIDGASQPRSCPMGTRSASLRVERPKHGAEHSPLSCAEVNRGGDMFLLAHTSLWRGG
jgi:hypothetical protein